MQKNYIATLFFVVTTASIGLGSAIAYAQEKTEQAPPPRPTWVDTEGKVKLDLLPREVPAVGPDGKLLKDDKGNDKMVPTHSNVTPPPPLR
jgi:hypothetical protein